MQSFLNIGQIHQKIFRVLTPTNPLPQTYLEPKKPDPNRVKLH